MSLPLTTYYPVALDTDDNLFVVHDALRMVLAEDYNPGDTSISLDGDPNVLAKWPSSGLITLTEQCSELDKRAVSFYYTSVNLEELTISGLEILPGFTDIIKPKRITNVTENVMAEHHNSLKDAAIAIQNFIGIQGTIDTNPLGDTLEGRINFLRKLVLVPKAYFTADRRIGLVPLTVNFKDLSFRLGTDGTTGDIKFVWDFGDETISVISTTISATSFVSVDDIDMLVEDLDGGEITKTYSTPGIYTVKLTVSNDHGSDTIIWPDLINPRIEAPLEASVEYTVGSTQAILFAGDPTGGPFTTPPRVRTPTNTLLTISIPDGENSYNTGYSYAGEKLNGFSVPIDPAVSFTWHLGDDLEHSSLSTLTKGSWSVGGVYDMKLRVDTAYGAYRITTYPNSIDVIEKTNLWLWSFTNSSDVVAYEFGLFSETFKAAGASSYTVNRNSTFLAGQANEAQLTREFKRNTGNAQSSTTTSGDGGNILLYYASGRNVGDSPTTETVEFTEFNGFSDTYDLTVPGFNRPWNWASFASSQNAYFAFGSPTTSPSPDVSPTNTTLSTYSIGSQTVSETTLSSSNFRNGASELLQNPEEYDGDGNGLYGHMSVYRTAWKGSTGYIARNDGVGDFFRIKSFYKTEGTVGTPVQFFTKLVDIPGSTSKLEGEMVDLTHGIYFFNNSGSISAYNDTSGIWETSGPATNTASFRTFQDTTVDNFDDPSNSLLAASDGDKKVYLSYDYSNQAFIKFHSGELAFTSLGVRPLGSQWIMSIY